MALSDMPAKMRSEIESLLAWKQTDFAIKRPKRGKIRAVSAGKLSGFICQLAGYISNILGETPNSFRDLVQQEFVERFVEWIINHRGVSGRSLRPSLGMVFAVVKYHPSFASHDFSWFKTLMDSIPTEPDSERKQRKTQKYVEYKVLEAIPDRIRAEKNAYERRKRKNPKRVASLAMEELVIRWLTILPWRQRNLRACRITGPNLNLFKAKIHPFSQLDKRTWVVEEEQKNPNAEFWQIRFSPEETKTGVAIHLLLPRQRHGPLEQYLKEYRPLLVTGSDAEVLLLNRNGAPLNSKLMQRIIGHWSLRFGGLRTTPHLFRDAVAFKWWKKIQETISHSQRCFGTRA